MLGNAAGFGGSYICLADGVQQGGLAMINVTENGHDRRARDQIGIFFVGNFLPPERQFAALFLFFHLLCLGNRLKTEFSSYNCRRIVINHLVDRSHDPICHQFLDDIDWADAHLFCQIANVDAHGNFDLFFAHKDTFLQ
jgi:hypothetical protein